MDTAFIYDPVWIPVKGERFVCACHFQDEAIRAHINLNGQLDYCSFCGESAKIVDFADFMEYVASTISRYFVTINDANLPLASSYYDKDDDLSIPGYVREGPFVTRVLAPSMEVPELLKELSLVTNNNDLNHAIEDCFNDSESWIKKEPLSITTEEENSFDWEEFCHTIKHKRRFSIEDEHTSEDIFGYKKPVSDIIDRIFSTIRQCGCIFTYREGWRLYRSRAFKDGRPTNFDDLTAPPDKRAKLNRMSPAGISMFYGASNSATSIAEMGEYDGTLFVGRFTLKRDVRLIDLTSLPSPSYWTDTHIGDIRFLREFAEEVSKPILPDDRDIDYLPTQAFTEYVRYRFKEDGKNIDGILYNSSVHKGKNVVLFCDFRASRDWLELTDFKEHGR